MPSLGTPSRTSYRGVSILYQHGIGMGFGTKFVNVVKDFILSPLSDVDINHILTSMLPSKYCIVPYRARYV